MNECVKIVHMLLCFVGINGDMSTFHFESAYVHVTFFLVWKPLCHSSLATLYYFCGKLKTLDYPR
jgi:hypothetical protein